MIEREDSWRDREWREFRDDAKHDSDKIQDLMQKFGVMEADIRWIRAQVSNLQKALTWAIVVIVGAFLTAVAKMVFK